MATLTPEAKQLLAKTIRGLRARLIADLQAAAESRYRLSVPREKAGLAEEPSQRRGRLEAWLEERVRATPTQNKKEAGAARSRFLLDAVKEAAATLLNRMVLLRHLEALGLVKPAVVTGGWNAKGYRELREFAPGLMGDESEGYATLLQLVFDEQALDMPGLFGDVGLTRLFPVPPATLRAVVEALDDPGLETAWTDDTTLGWVYQYWNDPEREALDAKLNDGGKIEPHEIASKTQMFTERYMVEWLLHNSLGLMWLCMCKKKGWTADAEAVLPVLDARRAEWRRKRDAGEVALDALMPIEGELEERWKYFVPQPIPDDAVASAPDSVRGLKLLDPACGSGHFLVIAFDLLAAMYREEARHAGQVISDREIAESILENNLHGIDIDPRSVQIAAAAVVLKAKRLAPDARPRRVNLVAPVLRLGNLPEDDPALVRLRHEVYAETGIPEELSNRVVKSLAGVDYLGSLLRVDAALDEAIAEHERGLAPGSQLALGASAEPTREGGEAGRVRAALLDKLEQFLAHHAGEEDLGLRLDGEQLAAGVRFVRMAREGTYDIVIGNPPYQGTSRMTAAGYVATRYPRGKADLFAAFIERGLELARNGGYSALLTMRNWMFLGQFEKLRENLLLTFDVRSIGDVDRGAFEDVPNEVLAAAMSVLRRCAPGNCNSVAVQPTPLSDKSYDRERTKRKRAALLAQVGRHEFSPRAFAAIEGETIVYWWSEDSISSYAASRKFGEVARIYEGLGTRNDPRYLRLHWEVPRHAIMLVGFHEGEPRWSGHPWVPFIKGADGRQWCDSILTIINWRNAGLEIASYAKSRFGRGATRYFDRGIAFVMLGSGFSVRAHRTRSIFGDMGGSAFPAEYAASVCGMNTARARDVATALNPTLHFRLGDVSRLPMVEVDAASDILSLLELAFTQHEHARESSSEFRRPDPSPWLYAQSWAQHAVDRAAGEGEPLPDYDPKFDPPTPVSFVSFAVGVALGRFGATGDGVLAEAPVAALPGGILFLTTGTQTDSLDHPACAPLQAAWSDHGQSVGEGDDLRTWLRTKFFKHHKTVYENRPIYFPLSSAKKSFVAWVSIHRWTSSTLQTLLADHLLPERRRLEGELEDLRTAKTRAERGARAAAERRFAEVQGLLEELAGFIDAVTQCAEQGPPPATLDETTREQDARYEMDLDDGVMVNSAALWPLLWPQWKDPKKWWHELAEANGRKDYDWAHLAKRYFPERVEAKCVEDPSLAVAHGCFWRLHPAKAYAWELRLQDEIRPDFPIDEIGSDEARAAFLRDHPAEAAEIREKEENRRERKARKSGEEESSDQLDLSAVEGTGEEAVEPVEAEVE
jgi:SAM-dependent methyltransferase